MFCVNYISIKPENIAIKRKQMEKTRLVDRGSITFTYKMF